MKGNGRPSKREVWMGLARIAGYHDDSRLLVRVIVENGGLVRREIINQQFRLGAQWKAAGMPCSCMECAS